MYFSVGSRLPVAHKKATSVTLQVARDSAIGQMISVNFSTQVGMEYRLTNIKVLFFTWSMCNETIIDTLFSDVTIIIHVMFITLRFILETVFSLISLFYNDSLLFFFILEKLMIVQCKVSYINLLVKSLES